MKRSTLVIGGIVAGGMGIAMHFMNAGVPESCSLTADGDVKLAYNDGTSKVLSQSGWRMNAEGTGCYFSNGGSVPPEFVPAR